MSRKSRNILSGLNWRSAAVMGVPWLLGVSVLIVVGQAQNEGWLWRSVLDQWSQVSTLAQAASPRVIYLGHGQAGQVRVQATAPKPLPRLAFQDATENLHREAAELRRAGAKASEEAARQLADLGEVTVTIPIVPDQAVWLAAAEREHGKVRAWQWTRHHGSAAAELRLIEDQLFQVDVGDLPELSGGCVEEHL